jgi:hypothetical protein
MHARGWLYKFLAEVVVSVTGASQHRHSHEVPPGEYTEAWSVQLLKIRSPLSTMLIQHDVQGGIS